MRALLLLLPLLSACAAPQLAASRGAIALPHVDFAGSPEAVDQLLARPLTAEEAVKVALLSHRGARAALAEVGIARGALVQAGLLPNPELEFELDGLGGAEPAHVALGVEYALTGALFAPLEASAAEAALEASRLQAAGALLDLAYEVRVAFFEAQAAQQRLELRLRALQSQQASYATALELSTAGNLPALALANERAAVELARVQVAEAENALLDAREGLTRAMGVSGERTGWALAGPLALPEGALDLQGAEERAVRASLELSELERRAEAAARQERLFAWQGFLPHVAFGVHADRGGDLWQLGARLAVELPLFDRADGLRLSARSEQEGLRARAEAAAAGLRSAVRRTLNRVESAERRARHYAARLLPARQEQLEQTLLQYNAMQRGVFEVLQAQRAVTETALGQVDATLDYWKARAALDLLFAGRSSPIQGGRVPASQTTAAASAGGH